MNLSSIWMEMKNSRQYPPQVLKTISEVRGHFIRKMSWEDLPLRTIPILFLGYPFYETKDKTRVRFETGKLNAVHAFGDDSLPRHGLYRWHILDPIAIFRRYQSNFCSRLEMMICHCLNVRTMWQQWLIGIRILQKDLTGHFRTEEHVCRGKNAGSYCSQVNM